MQPKIKSKVYCTDREVGEVSFVIVDPLTHDISHVVLKTGGRELMIPADGNIGDVTEDRIQLTFASAALANHEPFRREDYVLVKEVEIAHLERHLDVSPGDALVPIPALEKNIERRTFLQRFTNAIGLVLGLPLVYPVVRYLTFPMFQPLNNDWVKLGRAEQLGVPDLPKLIKFERKLKEGFLEREFTKSHWAVKATPEMLEKIYDDKDREFRDEHGKVVWVNRKDVDVVVFSGKCPHLGCAYRLRKHRRFGQTFVCPCHLTVFSPSGQVLDGPSPRGLDILPVRTTGNGGIEIIDMEFKAGRAEQIRIV